MLQLYVPFRRLDPTYYFIPIRQTIMEETTMEETIMEETSIKHIVISGGGTTGLSIFTLLRDSSREKFWDISQIKTMWGTSVGAMVLCTIALQLEWDTVYTYLLRRPWEQIFQTNLASIVNAYHNLGMYSIHEMEKSIAPLFLAKDMTIHTTMQEFYDKTNIEIHIFATEINSMSCVDISYKTHPNWRVIDAIYASSCLPGAFSPLFVGSNEAYIDGFFYCNYPLAKCLEVTGAHKEEVLGIHKSSSQTRNSESPITKDANMIEYLGKIIYMTMKTVFHAQPSTTIPYEVIIEGIPASAEDFNLVITQQSKRQELLDHGCTIWQKYSEVFKELKLSTSNI